MEYWITLIIAILAAARITRLLTLDTLTESWRENTTGMLNTLFSCAWCMGFWVSIPVIFSWHFFHTHTLWVLAAVILACSWIIGALSNASLPHRVEAMTIAPIVTINGDELHDDVEALDGDETTGGA